MNEPASHFVPGRPRLHYLQWNPAGRPALVLLHGGTANAWWWRPMAARLANGPRLLALDQRGHGDSEWVTPPAYAPADYVEDLGRFIGALELQRPILVGHSQGGINALAFAGAHSAAVRGVVAIDSAVSSGSDRNRYLRRLRSLPMVVYPDLATARARFRLMPREGVVAPAILNEIAEHSLRPEPGGGYTLKFDRESFYGSDGIDVLAVITKIRVPVLLIRAEHSRIMTAEGARAAVAANPRVTLTEMPGLHHHVLLERPDQLAELVGRFVEELG